MNECSTSITTSLLMSYGILDYRWQPSNNSSISPPHSLPILVLTVFHLYLESTVIYLSCLSLLSRSCSHPCDVWYVSLVRTTPGQHVDIPPCLFISPRRAECCWVVLINDIDRSTHCLTFSKRVSERETASQSRGISRRERERLMEKNNLLSIQFSFFLTNSVSMGTTAYSKR